MKTTSRQRPKEITFSYNQFRQEARTITFDVVQGEDGYEYETVTVPPGYWSRDSLISLIIEDRYPKDRMDAVVNNYLSDMTNAKHVASMKEMQDWRSHAKSVANGFFNVSPDLEELREEKLKELREYDNSTAVNEFFVAGQSTWLTPDKRTSYIVTIEAAIRNGQTEISFDGISVPVETAVAMLDAINLYAMRAADVTNKHTAAIRQLATEDGIRGYRFDTGYPEKLHFLEN